MSAAAWVEIGAVAAYAILCLVIACWPISEDEPDDTIDAANRLAPYGSQAAHDYAARRLIAEATSDIPYRLLEEWVEQ